jgi:hypothetical protein
VGTVEGALVDFVGDIVVTVGSFVGFGVDGERTGEPVTVVGAAVLQYPNGSVPSGDE